MRESALQTPRLTHTDGGSEELLRRGRDGCLLWEHTSDGWEEHGEEHEEAVGAAHVHGICEFEMR
jgi:hypothetical protein